jgi:hypothetical protein
MRRFVFHEAVLNRNMPAVVDAGVAEDKFAPFRAGAPHGKWEFPARIMLVCVAAAIACTSADRSGMRLLSWLLYRLRVTTVLHATFIL